MVIESDREGYLNCPNWQLLEQALPSPREEGREELCRNIFQVRTLRAVASALAKVVLLFVLYMFSLTCDCKFTNDCIA